MSPPNRVSGSGQRPCKPPDVREAGGIESGPRIVPRLDGGGQEGCDRPKYWRRRAIRESSWETSRKWVLGSIESRPASKAGPIDAEEVTARTQVAHCVKYGDRIQYNTPARRTPTLHILRINRVAMSLWIVKEITQMLQLGHSHTTLTLSNTESPQEHCVRGSARGGNRCRNARRASGFRW